MPDIPRGRPTHCIIDHRALRANFRAIKKTIGARVQVLAMVKANAYGHGAVAVARTLIKSGCDAFGVATVTEGIELRRGGITQPILVVGGVYRDQLDDYLRFKLTPVLHESATIHALEKELSRRRRSLRFQIEIDTGMGRVGFLARAIDEWLPVLIELKHLRLEGAFSHFSEAESAGEAFSERQSKTYATMLQRLRAAGVAAPSAHMSKSAALITMPAANFDMVRPGLILYGVYPAPPLKKKISLSPLLSWTTRIIQLKRVPKGTPIGYSRTFVTKRPSLIATLPVGYADGYNRLFSNRAAVLVRGKRAPVVGRVSMDLTTIDVTDIRNVQQGDEVVLLGRQNGAEIGADELAAWANTISYEIFTSIGARVPRIHKNN